MGRDGELTIGDVARRAGVRTSALRYYEERRTRPADPSCPRTGAIVEAMIHSYDHYGQMVEYLRMNGIVPPVSRR